MITPPPPHGYISDFGETPIAARVLAARGRQSVKGKVAKATVGLIGRSIRVLTASKTEVSGRVGNFQIVLFAICKSVVRDNIYYQTVGISHLTNSIER